MSINISDELKRTFSLASLRNEAAKKLNAKEWKQYQVVTKKHDDLRKDEQRNFHFEYDTRVEVARKRLINKAGAKNKDFKHKWFGSDNFDKSAIDRQAKRQVHAQHHNLLGHLEARKLIDLESLMDRSEHRSQLREKPINEFSRASERRQNQEQRQTDKGPAYRRSTRRVQ